MPTRSHMVTMLLAVIALTLFMALTPKPPALPIDWAGDKFEHIIAFAVLAGLARLSFVRASDWAIVEKLSFLGALIEMFQAIPALHRDCDWRDWVADTLAAAMVLLVLRIVPKFRRPPSGGKTI